MVPAEMAMAALTETLMTICTVPSTSAWPRTLPFAGSMNCGNNDKYITPAPNEPVVPGQLAFHDVQRVSAFPRAFAQAVGEHVLLPLPRDEIGGDRDVGFVAVLLKEQPFVHTRALQAGAK